MKRFFTLFAFVFYLFSYQPIAFALVHTAAGEPSVYDTIQKGEQPASHSAKKTGDSGSSIFSIFIKFIVSFVFVIFLLFVLLRFLSKRSRQIPSGGPILPLGDHALGNNRSVQVLLIGQTIYIVGVGETVTLLRTISQGEEYQHLLESLENQEEEPLPKWLPSDTKRKWDTVFQKHIKNIKKHHGEG